MTFPFVAEAVAGRAAAAARRLEGHQRRRPRVLRRRESAVSSRALTARIMRAAGSRLQSGLRRRAAPRRAMRNRCGAVAGPEARRRRRGTPDEEATDPARRLAPRSPLPLPPAADDPIAARQALMTSNGAAGGRRRRHDEGRDPLQPGGRQVGARDVQRDRPRPSATSSPRAASTRREVEGAPRDLDGRGRLRRPSWTKFHDRDRCGGRRRPARTDRPTRRPSRPRRCGRSSGPAGPATKPSASRTEAGRGAAAARSPGSSCSRCWAGRLLGR